jgi:AP2 domain
MKEINLTQGKIALVDDDDYWFLMNYTWRAVNKDDRWYAATSIGGNTHYMHRMIMKCKSSDEIDHKDRNGLNNQKYNLRKCSRSQNQANKRKQIGTYSSIYKGVTWHKGQARWISRIRINGHLIQLGSFLLEKDAARKYDEAAIKLFGEFAKLNFNDE